MAGSGDDEQPDRVRATVAGIEASGVKDTVSLWHPGHVGMGASDEWRRLLSREQVATVLRETAGFRRKFGYADRPDAAPIGGRLLRRGPPPPAPPRPPAPTAD